MKFNATLELARKTATGITVPEEVIEKIGAGRRPCVRETINDFAFETTIGVMGGQYKIPVSAERRQAAGVSASDELRGAERAGRPHGEWGSRSLMVVSMLIATQTRERGDCP